MFNPFEKPVAAKAVANVHKLETKHYLLRSKIPVTTILKDLKVSSTIVGDDEIIKHLKRRSMYETSVQEYMKKHTIEILVKTG